MLKTFGQLKRSGFRQVASADPEGEEFRRLANECVEALLNRGDWRGTITPVRFCVNNGFLTWPRFVHSIRKLNVGHREIDTHNVWYQFIDKDFYSNCIGQPFDNIVNGLNRHDQFREMNAFGYASTYTDVPAPSYIQAYPSLASDALAGKTVTIFGKDSNGQPLRTLQPSGAYKDGMVITLATPFGISPVAVQAGSIRVVKDETEGDVRLYTQDVTTGALLDIAYYAPDETTPNYPRYKLNAGYNRNGCNTFSVLALVKLEFIPVRCDTDVVLIDNIQAMKFACQSIKKSEAGDFEGAEIYMQKAVHELNMSLQNETTDDQISFKNETFSGIRPHRRIW